MCLWPICRLIKQLKIQTLPTPDIATPLYHTAREPDVEHLLGEGGSWGTEKGIHSVTEGAHRQPSVEGNGLLTVSSRDLSWAVMP